MRLADSETVDYLSLESGSGTVVATLVDDFVGTDEIARLALLQKKLNRYLDFIESGEIYQRLAQSAGIPVSMGSRVRVSIVARQKLVGEGQRFLRHAEEAAKGANVELSFKIVPV